MIVLYHTDNEELFFRNYLKFSESGLGFNTPYDIDIWEFVEEFCKTNNHVPDMKTVVSHFERNTKTDIVDRLTHFDSLTPVTRGDFEKLVEDSIYYQRVDQTTRILSEASVIVQTGIEIKEGRQKKFLKGPQDAIRYVTEQGHDVIRPTFGSRLTGEVTSDGEQFLEEYERVKADPLSGIGQFCGIEQIDIALRGAKAGELWTHAAHTGGLKCVAGNTEIFDLSTGSLRTVKEVFDSGDLPIVHTLNQETWKLETQQVSHVMENGVRDILKIQTQTGRVINVSGNHPFLTDKGWCRADQLVEGQSWVGVPKQLKFSTKNPTFTPTELKLIGYFLGDGSLGYGIGFTSYNPTLMEDFISCLEVMGHKESTGDKPGYPSYRLYNERKEIKVSKNAGHPRIQHTRSPVFSLLDRVGLIGKTSGSKFIPREVWNVSDKDLWVFISALWATDGRIGIDPPRKGRTDKVSLSYTSKSWELTWGLKLLLQRLGVSSTLSDHRILYQGEHRTYWTVLITQTENKKLFLESVDVVGKEEAVAKSLSVIQDTKDQDLIPTTLLCNSPSGTTWTSNSGHYRSLKAVRSRETVRRSSILEMPFSEEVQKIGACDLWWEKIISIERLKPEMTYDFSVPKTHNFVANGFVVHNTTLTLNWMYNQSVYFRHGSLYVSLEMPYSQVRRILYAIHSYNSKFTDVRLEMGLQREKHLNVGLPYSKIRDGGLSEMEEFFLKEVVVPDFNNTANEYGKIHIEVADPDKSDFTVLDLRASAERIHSKHPFKTIFIDHMGLMSPRKWNSSTTERLNEIFRDTKRLALSFKRGQGIAVVALHQISRDGWRRAQEPKKKGKDADDTPRGYDLSALSYANESERSSDVVTTTYVDDDLKAAGFVRFQNLKSRDNKPFDPFLAQVDWDYRRIKTYHSISVEDIDAEELEKDLAEVINK